jgi:hypothetical protein
MYRWKYDKIREYNQIGNPFKAMNLHVMNDLHLYGNHFACISFSVVLLCIYTTTEKALEN